MSCWGAGIITLDFDFVPGCPSSAAATEEAAPEGAAPAAALDASAMISSLWEAAEAADVEV